MAEPVLQSHTVAMLHTTLHPQHHSLPLTDSLPWEVCGKLLFAPCWEYFWFSNLQPFEYRPVRVYCEESRLGL